MPYKDKAAKADAQRRRRERKRGTSGPPPGDAPGEAPQPSLPPLALRTPADVLAALEEAVNSARADQRAGPQVRARTIGFLASVLLKAIQVGDQEERLAEVERQLRGQKP